MKYMHRMELRVPLYAPESVQEQVEAEEDGSDDRVQENGRRMSVLFQKTLCSKSYNYSSYLLAPPTGQQ